MDSTDCKQYHQAQFCLKNFYQLLIHCGALKKRQSNCHGQALSLLSHEKSQGCGAFLCWFLSHRQWPHEQHSSHKGFPLCPGKEFTLVLVTVAMNNQDFPLLQIWASKGKIQNSPWLRGSGQIYPLKNLLFVKIGSFTLFLQRNVTINKSVLTGKTDYGIKMV